jgi:hypothetical protein
MFGSTLPPVVCRRADVLLCFVCMFTYIDVQHFAVAHLHHDIVGKLLNSNRLNKR